MIKWEGTSEKVVDLLEIGGVCERLKEGGG